METKYFSFGLNGIDFDVIAVPFNKAVWYRAEGIDVQSGAAVTLDLGAVTSDKAELIERAKEVLQRGHYNV